MEEVVRHNACIQCWRIVNDYCELWEHPEECDLILEYDYKYDLEEDKHKTDFII